MELKEGTNVFSANGEEVGKINRFVINPVTKKVSHVVVQKGLLIPEDKVVPVDWIASTTDERVTLSMNSAEVHDLPPFEEVHYVNLDESETQRLANAPYNYVPAYYWYPPYGAASFASPYYPPEVASDIERNIPEKTVPLQEGANVISVDGDHVGDVEQVFINPGSDRATHLLIGKGFLLKERKLVPIEWINSISENRVLLAVGSKFIDQLPDYKE